MNKIKELLIALYKLIPFVIILMYMAHMWLGDKTSAAVDLLIYLIFKVHDVLKAVEKK